jgi:hypothetical protein
MKLPRTPLAALSALSLAAGAAQAQYSNDFESGVGPNLSVSSGTLATLHTPGACTSATYCTNFLGIASTAPQPLDNHTVSLTLTGLSAHTGGTLSFSLFILESWDGDGSQGFGPDGFTVTAGGTTLLNTTFGIALGNQHYPGNIPGPTVARRTGEVEGNTLGYNGWGNSVYEIVLPFTSSAPNLVITFAGSGLQAWGDEGWGIDNLEVTLDGVSAVPEPSTYVLLAGGLAGLGVVAQRRRTR